MLEVVLPVRQTRFPSADERRYGPSRPSFAVLVEVTVRRPNHVLAEQLALVGWRPPRLVAAVNALLGEGYLSRSTVSEWLHAGRIPREPLPAIVALLLSEASSSQISVRDLWPRAGLAPAWAVPADAGLADIERAPSPAVALAQDWIRHSDRSAARDRRRFIPIPGTALPTASPRVPTASAATTGCWELTALAIADQFCELPPGPSAVSFAYRQTIALAETLTESPHESDLIAALAVITAAAGMLAHAAGERGLAQRYAVSSAVLRRALGTPSGMARTE